MQDCKTKLLAHMGSYSTPKKIKRVLVRRKASSISRENKRVLESCEGVVKDGSGDEEGPKRTRCSPGTDKLLLIATVEPKPEPLNPSPLK